MALYSRPINIAIDTIFFQMSYSGITRVWETLFKNFLDNKNNKDYQIILLYRGNGKTFKFKPELNIENKFKLLLINEFNYLTMNQDVDYLNYICKTNNIDVFISTYYTYCTVIPNILLIHDMIPEVFKFVLNHMWKQKQKAILNASAFITISKTTKNDLIKFYPYIEKNNYPIEIIYNSIGTIAGTIASTIDNTFLKQFGIIPKSYIFSIATNNEEYKNIKLIKSLGINYGNKLAKILNNPIPIILISKENIPNGFKVENNILYISFVNDSILNSLYKNALCFVAPTLYEGFGLPIFEAFAHSTPVIAIKLPIFIELGGGGINFIDIDSSSNIDSIDSINISITNKLFEKIEFIYKNEGSSVSKRVEFGLKQVAKFTEEIQSCKWNEYFKNIRTNILEPKPFINLIIQSYKESNPERLKELEYCFKQNLDNPYINSIHDFGSGIDSGICSTNAKYIIVDNPDNKWLTYDMAFKYATKYNSTSNYWCIVNLDIFLDKDSNWNMIKGMLNNGYIYAQSRHEFNILQNGKIDCKMDTNFAKMMHSHTQDAWLFKTPINISSSSSSSCSCSCSCSSNCDFELGFLGCDNAIADRLNKSGYKVINQPITYKIFHYDIVKGKTSSNFIEKHNSEKNIKPKNKYPERIGSYLVPNFDQLLGEEQDINMTNIINGLGGISNIEKYELICKIMSDRIIMNNP
jgi:hypothetical protein